VKRAPYILALVLTVIGGRQLVTQIANNNEMLIYSYLIKTDTEQFQEKTRSISRKLNIDPNWLMACMYLESTLDHRKQNPKSGATGLIQFLPETAKWLGTTTANLVSMSAVEQLDYVYKHLYPYRNRMHSFTDVYFAIFFPAAMGKPDDYVLQTARLSAGLIASQNKAYDLDRNMQITVAEVKTAIMGRIRSDYWGLLQSEKKKLI
jgi:hypothetical protein